MIEWAVWVNEFAKCFSNSKLVCDISTFLGFCSCSSTFSHEAPNLHFSCDVFRKFKRFTLNKFVSLIIPWAMLVEDVFKFWLTTILGIEVILLDRKVHLFKFKVFNLVLAVSLEAYKKTSPERACSATFTYLAWLTFVKRKLEPQIKKSRSKMIIAYQQTT